jgi:hypothetical protein
MSDDSTPATPSEADAATGASALSAWSNITQTPEMIDYFQGVFTKVALTVEETGEAFTATHHGDRVSFTPGMDPDAEFVVPVKQENINNLLAYAADGRFDAEESWRIVQVLFTPLTRAALQSPAVKRNWLRWLAGVEPVIHVHLLHPNNGAAVTHTLAFAGNQWLVIPGLHGRPGRTYRLTPTQALDFQRQIYKALKSDSTSAWWQFANWYREWRIGVSSTT